MNLVGIGNDCLPEFFSIIAANAVHIGISHDRGGIVADHTSAMSRTRPLRQESALQISIGQTFLDFHALVRINQVHQREKTSECVPEPGVCRHIAGTDFAVIRAVMYPLAICIDLGKVAREEERAIKAGVEGAQTVDV